MRGPSILVAALALTPAVAADQPAYWGKPAADGGRCCTSLSEVRAHIDAIDERIVAAMAERAEYVAEAGRFKRDPAAVSDPARIDAIIASVRARAVKAGLPPDVAEKTYRAMIAAFEDYERSEWAKRNGAPR